VRFRILGPLEITDDAGAPVVITRPLHRSALALLLLNAGRPCSARSLAVGLWGDNPPLSPDVSLRSCVYGIRKTLPDARRLRTHAAGYLITAGPGELDLDDFRDLARRGREALDAGNARLAATLLSQAVDLWRDPPLADLPATPARERLLGQQKEAQVALTDARLAVGEHRQMLTDLRGVVASDPLHEHAWAQLITALYRSGARTEALAEFGKLRMTLISAYGIDPGPELQDLHQRILADDPDLMLSPAAIAPAQPTPGMLTTPASSPPPATQVLAAVPTEPWSPKPVRAEPGRWQPMCQLPKAIADLTGRATELARLRSVLSRRGMSITVVTGMLGVGKTALAVQAAQAAKAWFPDGQLFASLDDGGRPRDPQVVLGELLRGLGVPAASIPAAKFEREALFRSILSGRRVLLVADGASSAAQVKPLLPATAGSAVVVTSRARLPDLEGARLIELGALDPANAVLMLARISGRNIGNAYWDAAEDAGTEAADTDADETEAGAAKAIATACGYLPLALRIAGARLADDPELTVTDLAILLSDESRRLDELAVGQASIRTRLAAAAHGVSATARHALALLAGGQGRAAGAAFSEDPKMNKVARELADAGLLDQVAGNGNHASDNHGSGHHGNGNHGYGRSYQVHPLVRAYAHDLLAAADPGFAGSATGRLLESGWLPHSGRASSRRITTRVCERRTTSPNPARS
jgi:DNA-binding SARP family transcriptional activator